MEENMNVTEVTVVEKKGLMTKIKEHVTPKKVLKGALVLGAAGAAYVLGYKKGSNDSSGFEVIDLDADIEE